MVNPVLLIVVPLGLAFTVPLFGFISKKTVKYIPVVAMGFNLILSLLLIPRVLEHPLVLSIGGFPPPFCINLTVGPLGILLSAVIALIGFLVSIYAMDYIRKGSVEKYQMLYILLLVGATGAVLTGDIFNLFVFFEILCISSYALVAYFGDSLGVEAAIKYLIQGAIGSTFMLLGIGLLYGMFGTLNMADIAKNIKLQNSIPISLFVPLALFITGMGVEAAIFPLNSWLPDAHSSAPSSISAILSGIAIKIGVYGVVRVMFTLFGMPSIFHLLLFIGIITLLIGELAAFGQTNIKRMLAYSSIGQIGLIVFALGIATPYGISGGLFQILSHALSKALLFLAVGYMIYRTGSMDISTFQGIGRKMPLTSLAFTIGAFSLIGLPPFIGFPSKFLIVRAALAKKEGILFIVLIFLVLFATIIEGAYFFRVIQVLYFKENKENQDKKDAPFSALVPLIILTVFILFIGIYPKPVMKLLRLASWELLNKMDYIKWVLGAG